ncbi:hypothetical protein I79_016933 [Cricetulus griseus]|uniref:Uncharacterized protein n=1 Tax=Cricetulus griseus TaxID=10029 RepID=G3I0P4_CRIGR|nr:hypothetical protein I79_016933 [Cricetulus griseus]
MKVGYTTDYEPLFQRLRTRPGLCEMLSRCKSVFLSLCSGTYLCSAPNPVPMVFKCPGVGNEIWTYSNEYISG